MDDCVYRQAVIDMFQHNAYDDWNQGISTTWANAFSECANMVRDIPSADVEPVRRGQWAEENGFIYCPFCGDPWGAPGCESMVKSFNYCPNCGARMEGD